MTREQKLEAIARRCRELLAIAEKRTQGAWYVDYAQGVMAPNGSPISYIHLAAASTKPVPDAKFIASCAGAAEAGWRATLAAIDLSQEIRRHYGEINIMLHAILNEKEEEILQSWEGQYQ